MDNVPEKVVPEGNIMSWAIIEINLMIKVLGFVDNDALIGKAMFIYYARDWNRITEEIH